MAIESYHAMIFAINYLWRFVATALSFILFGIMGLLIPWVIGPWLYWRYANQRQRQQHARTFIHLSFRWYIHALRGLGVVTWDVRHAERLQRPGLLVLANHPCLLDVAFLMAFIPNPNCIVKERLFSNPFMRGYLRLTGFIANNEAVGLIEDARASIAGGSSLIIFPEGTRTAPGEPLRFQRGAANVALRAQTRITPVTIVCEPLTLTKKHRWYQIPRRKPHISLQVGEDLPLVDYYQQPVAGAARMLTRDLQLYFTEELKNHERDIHRRSGAGVETADYRHIGP